MSESLTTGKTAETGESKGNYAFVSLGFPKNLVDSEKMLGTLALWAVTRWFPNRPVPIS
ncbi:MAG: hypothetical protein Ct9H300mP1_01870 [Planctomycetaceae bacterium]|nr:MAG: hypothetical protein Ct9H300mP1_01870 [Planctomycetaceae bacterium]